MNRIIPYVGALALSVALFTGCQDSTTGIDPTSTSATQDEAIFKVYSVDESVNALELPQTYDAAIASIQVLDDPNNPPVLGDGRDSVRKGGDDTVRKGGGDTVRKGGGDTVRKGGDDRGGLRPDNYIRILKQLHLTDEQWVAVRGCFHDYQECVRKVHARYQDAIKNLRDAFQADLARLKAAVAAGEISPEDARIKYRRIVEGYKMKAEDLKKGLRGALEECHKSLLDCIKHQLTAEQLARFEVLLKGGPNVRG
jgi:hypothetical protein